MKSFIVCLKKYNKVNIMTEVTIIMFELQSIIITKLLLFAIAIMSNGWQKQMQ